MIIAPKIIKVEQSNFFIKCFSLNNFVPKNTLNIVDNWKSASAYATLIWAKTTFVEYCIKPTEKISSNWYLMLDFWIENLCFAKRQIKNEKNKPEIAQRENALFMLVKRIIFFIKIASVAEKIRAINLNNVDFEKNEIVLFNKKVPRIINNIPKQASNVGISFNSRKAIIRAMTGLKELIGAMLDNSPQDNDFIIKRFPKHPKNPINNVRSMILGERIIFWQNKKLKIVNPKYVKKFMIDANSPFCVNIFWKTFKNEFALILALIHKIKFNIKLLSHKMLRFKNI